MRASRRSRREVPFWPWFLGQSAPALLLPAASGVVDLFPSPWREGLTSALVWGLLVLAWAWLRWWWLERLENDLLPDGLLLYSPFGEDFVPYWRIAVEPLHWRP